MIDNIIWYFQFRSRYSIVTAGPAAGWAPAPRRSHITVPLALSRWSVPGSQGPESRAGPGLGLTGRRASVRLPRRNHRAQCDRP